MDILKLESLKIIKKKLKVQVKKPRIEELKSIKTDI